MKEEAKKTSLRMIPYGLYVLTAESPSGQTAAATINWVTQTSFQPPLVVAGLKVDSGAFAVTKESGAFVLNMLGKEQGDAAFAFFKPAQREGDSIAGQRVRQAKNGAWILEEAPAWLECRVVEILEKGDHATVVAEVTEAGLKAPIEGRPDDAILHLRDLGEKTFYGG